MSSVNINRGMVPFLLGCLTLSLSSKFQCFELLLKSFFRVSCNNGSSTLEKIIGSMKVRSSGRKFAINESQFLNAEGLALCKA